MRPGPRKRKRALANLVGIMLIVVLIGLVVAGIRLRQDEDQATFTARPLGLNRIALERPLYARDDPWKAYLAPESACPGGEDRTAPLLAQQRTMVCLLNWARQRRGLSSLPENPTLSVSARLKAQDISRCADFAHEACGRKPDDVARQAGYQALAWGENLYVGPREYGRPRVALDQWLNSDGHRVNLLRDRWTEQGVALLPVRAFNGQRDVAIWVSHFGHGRQQ